MVGLVGWLAEGVTNIVIEKRVGSLGAEIHALRQGSSKKLFQKLSNFLSGLSGSFIISRSLILSTILIWVILGQITDSTLPFYQS